MKFIQLELEEEIMTEQFEKTIAPIIAKLDKQLTNAQTKVHEIQAHIAALKRLP